MVEFINRNLDNAEPEYFYSVTEFVTTFGKDPGKNESFTHEEFFKGNDLLKCRADAVKYYWERLNGLENSKYFLPFAAPKDFVSGKNSAFSIYLSLVQYYSEDHFEDYIILGEDDNTTAEAKEFEMLVLREKGYL